MDFDTIKININELRHLLKKNNISPSLFLLFGSYAKNKQNEHSDIDLAVVSKDFGKDRFKEGVKLNRLGHKINPRFELIPVSLKDYLTPETINPILHEIKKDGIPIM